MTIYSSERFPILFRRRWPTTDLADTIEGIDVDALCGEYEALHKAAPIRSERNKRHFVGHDGHLDATDPGNPSENHLAIALWRLGSGRAPASTGWLRLLDYQFPLYAADSDRSLRGVDLLAATDDDRLAVVELKVRRPNRARYQSPLRALMQALRYTAVVQANHRAIAVEASDLFAIDLADAPPIVQILAPRDWWDEWCDMPRRTRRAAGPWESRFLELAARLEARLGIAIECAQLDDTGLDDIAWDAHGPCVPRAPAMSRVPLDREPERAAVDYAGYEAAVRSHLWAWADRHHSSELDGGPRTRRPPVLEARLASKGVLVPVDPTRARSIASALPRSERHPRFSSLKSSQALAQSVFGAICAFGRLDLLDGVSAECGRPAFLADTKGASLVLEHKVRTLDEPRQTSVDVLVEGPSKRVAVECKFTEDEFGRCSRTRLRPGDPTYPEQHCDGNYRVQRGRRERCALTEIGVLYWTYLPRLFRWNADRDLRPCPFSPTYQLARNALAATVTDNGFDAASGHVLVVYDARNPEFGAGGDAQSQYEAAIGACRIPGLIRRLSWQRLTVALVAAPELAYLTDALEAKYGIQAE